MVSAGDLAITQETTIFVGTCKTIKVVNPADAAEDLLVSVAPLHGANEWDRLGPTTGVYGQEYEHDRGAITSVRVKPAVSSAHVYWAVTSSK